MRACILNHTAAGVSTDPADVERQAQSELRRPTSMIYTVNSIELEQQRRSTDVRLGVAGEAEGTAERHPVCAAEEA